MGEIIGTVVVTLSRNMSTFMDRYFGIQRDILSLIGFWYNQSYKTRVIRYSIIGFMLTYSILTQTCLFFTLDSDLRSIVFALQLFIPDLCFTTLYYNCIPHFVTIQKIYGLINEDWERPKNSFEESMMKKVIHGNKMFTWTCMVTFAIFSAFFIFVPILQKIASTGGETSHNSRFPIATCTDYFIDREKYYYPIIISQLIIIFIAILIAIGCYSSYFLVIQHICACLIIIKNKIQQPFIKSQSNDSVLAKPMDLSYWMIDIIQDCARAKELTKLINALAGKVNLLQVFLALLFMVVDFLCLFQIPMLLQQKERSNDVFMYLTFIIGSTFPVYILCYLGQKTMDCSLDIYREMYLVPIHDISLKTQKLLLTALIISTKPCTISIGQVFVSSHEFFSDLLRTALSLAMVIHSTEKK